MKGRRQPVAFGSLRSPIYGVDALNTGKYGCTQEDDCDGGEAALYDRGGRPVEAGTEGGNHPDQGSEHEQGKGEGQQQHRSRPGPSIGSTGREQDGEPDDDSQEIHREQGERGEDRFEHDGDGFVDR